MVSPSWQGFKCFASFPRLPSFSVTARLYSRSKDHPLLLCVHTAPRLGMKQEEAGMDLLGDRDASWGQASGAEPIWSLLLVSPALLSGSYLGLALPGAGTKWTLHHVLGFEVPSRGGSQPQTQPGAGGNHCVCHARLQGSFVPWWHIHIVTPVSFLPRQETEAQSSQS